MDKVGNQAVLPSPVNWEAVRALAMVVGVREAARRMGISEEAAMKHSQRKGWLASPEAKRANQIAISQRSGITVAPSPQMSAGALIQAEIAALGSKTRLNLAHAVNTAGEHLKTLDGAAIVEQSSNVKNIAQTADLVHGWKDAAPQVKIRLDLLGSTQEPIADVTLEAETEVVTDWSEDQDLDSY